jgi:hypothetical protein
MSQKCLRDDWNRVIDKGMPFSDYCPNWRNVKVWTEWTNYAVNCFGPGMYSIYRQLQITCLMDIPDDSQNVVVNNRSKKNMVRIPIVTNSNGEPEIPSLIVDDNSAKVVQWTVRDYCLAHIRQCVTHSASSYITQAHRICIWKEEGKDTLVQVVW